MEQALKARVLEQAEEWAVQALKAVGAKETDRAWEVIAFVPTAMKNYRIKQGSPAMRKSAQNADPP